MRILAIRGENLASLAAPFAVDLSDGPLAATGIFAITGETGAGKSTILDALCLALYGRYPRVTTGRREDAPDPAGEPIGSNDGRAILRRGAGQGHAEVDFVGQDGRAYRVRWEAVRARGRANGKLQADRRLLERLDDATAVAAGKTAVAEWIERLTDLTFDQFRRTVLLAQGEFDAFLLSAEGERSELLEKITGTTIYSEISKRVHAGTEAKRAALRELEAARRAVGLLDEAARAERHAARDRLAGETVVLSGELAGLNAALAQARRLEETRAQAAAAEARLAAARRALEAHHDESLRLAELDAVETLRGPADAVARAAAELAAAEAALALALARREEAEAASSLAAEAHAGAAGADEAAETEFKALGPVWTLAADLDSRIGEAAREAAAAAEASATASARAAEARAALAELDTRLAAAEAAAREAADRFAADTGGAFLAGRTEEAGLLFDKRATLSADLAGARLALRRAGEESTRRSALIATGEAAIATARAARQEAAERRAVRAAALERIGEADLRLRSAILDRLAEGLREAAPLARLHAEAALTLARALADGAAAGEAEADAIRAGTEAAAAEERAAALRAAVAPLAELAEEALSHQAAHLRSLLVEGEPCPVCGAADHPHARSADGLGRVADALRAQRAGHDAALDAARAAITGAAAARAAAGARLHDSGRVAATARAGLARAAAAYAELLPPLAEARGKAGLAAPLPEALDGEAPARLASLAEATAAARAPLLTALDGARILRDEIDGLTARIEAAGRESEAAERACAAEREALRLADLAAGREAVRVAGLAERVESLGREIAPYLAAAGLDPADLDRDGAAAIRRVARIAADHRALDEGRLSCDRTVQTLRSDRIAAFEAVGFTAPAAAEAEVLAGRRQERLAALRAERAPLLGGEETGTHRTRVNASRRAAREALTRTESARATAGAALASAATAAEHASAARGKSLHAHEESVSAFAAACAPRSVGSVRESLALGPDIRAGLRRSVEARALEARAAETALATRQADLAPLLEAPPVDVPATQDMVAGLARAIADHQQSLGALAADLRRDDEAREQAAGLERQASEAQAEWSTWEAVNDAVGSAGGEKFRRFAQGVTLDHLVRLANEHLLALSPRYRLMRGDVANLTLHVVDRDMGEEVRATRSLSGGERFLVSLALALALAGLEGRESFVDTLFIDEGFGSLDAETLDLAVDALETLQGRGRKVGVITHVAGMIERIAVQVRVEKRGGGRSVVRVVEAGPG